MANFYSMMRYYAEHGGGDKEKMWKSIEVLDEHFEHFEKAHKEDFWKLMRELHEVYAGPHFNEEFARWQVSMMHHKGADGKVYKGEHWSIEQTNAVIAKYKSVLPKETTEWDMYTVLNSGFHDKCTLFKKWFEGEYEEKIIEDAINFYFMDEDAPEGKVWKYFKAMDECDK